MKKLLLLLCCLLFVAGNSSAYTVPSGYVEIDNAVGVKLFQKGADFVQVVQLNSGAQILLRAGTLGSGDRGFEPVSRFSLEDDWAQFSSTSESEFSTTNGSFFSASDCDVYTSVGIAFSLKINNFMVAYGYGNNSEYVGQKMVWEIWNDEVNISPFDDDWHSLQTSAASNGIVGLNEFASKNPSASIARTFVGCADLNGNGRYSTVLIFSSTASTQSHAAGELRAFGASQVMMLDGGGSTQMICKGISRIGSCRALPQTIRVAAVPPYKCAYNSQNPSGDIPRQRGDVNTYWVKFKNTGTDTWQNTGNFGGGYPHYVELWGVRSDGNPENSDLYHSATWTNRQRVGSMLEPTVAPGQIATFQFTGEVAGDAALGTHICYFRPYHATAGLMNDWGGMSFNIDVYYVNPAANLSFETDGDGNGVADNWELRSDFGGVVATHESGQAPAFSGCNPYSGGGSYKARLYNSSASYWSAIGHANAGSWGQLLNADGTWYRMSFWYRTTDNIIFGCRLATSDIAYQSRDVGAYVTQPLRDGNWHRFIGSPFQVSSGDLSTYPKIAFYLEYGNAGTVEIDDFQVLNSNSCHP